MSLWYVSFLENGKIEKVGFEKKKNAVIFAEEMMDSIKVWRD